MSADELTNDDFLRIKNFLTCAWIGMIYAACVYILAVDIKWYMLIGIAVLFGGTCYLQVGRGLLQGVAAVFLLVTLLGIMGIVPTGPDLRRVVVHTMTGCSG